jgi:TRAP-type transport system small permease protein
VTPPPTLAARLLRWADGALQGCAVLLFLVMVGLVIAQVVARKFFEPLVWSEELARYLFIWVSFLGWAIASRRRSHVSIGMLVDRVGPAARRAFGVFADVATLVLMSVLLRYGGQLVRNNSDVETVTLFFNYSVVYAAVPLAALCIVVTTLGTLHERFTVAVANRELAL